MVDILKRTQENTRRSPNAAWILVHRLRHWPSIQLTVYYKYYVFDGLAKWSQRTGLYIPNRLLVTKTRLSSSKFDL